MHTESNKNVISLKGHHLKYLAKLNRHLLQLTCNMRCLPRG